MALPIAELSERLKIALAKREMKPIELSTKTGIPKSAISQYMSGYAKPKDDRVYLICKALGINEGWLLGYDVEMEKKVFNKSEGSKDAELLYKISLLNERDKTVIISMINSMIENKVGN